MVRSAEESRSFQRSSAKTRRLYTAWYAWSAISWQISWEITGDNTPGSSFSTLSQWSLWKVDGEYTRPVRHGYCSGSENKRIVLMFSDDVNGRWVLWLSSCPKEWTRICDCVLSMNCNAQFYSKLRCYRHQAVVTYHCQGLLCDSNISFWPTMLSEWIYKLSFTGYDSQLCCTQTQNRRYQNFVCEMHKEICRCTFFIHTWRGLLNFGALLVFFLNFR